nr:immunoglobulin heavy chain junction region [Mus musculus]
CTRAYSNYPFAYW